MAGPIIRRSVDATHLQTITLGHPIIDEYLTFAGARLRLNSWLAAAFDLKVFFSVIRKEPQGVTTADVFAFIKAQRAPRFGPTVVRLEDGEVGLSARTCYASERSKPPKALGPPPRMAARGAWLVL